MKNKLLIVFLVMLVFITGIKTNTTAKNNLAISISTILSTSI